MGAAPVALLDAGEGIGPHEWRRHRDLRAVGNDEIGLLCEFFDIAEKVIPPSAIEPGAVVAQFVKDFRHLEARQDVLDEDGGLDAALGNAEEFFRSHEYVVPEARLEVMLQLGEVEIDARAARQALAGVVEEIHGKVEQAGACGFATDQEMFLGKVPAARAHQERGRLGAQRVLLPLGACVGDGAADRVDDVCLSLERRLPRSGSGRPQSRP